MRILFIFLLILCLLWASCPPGNEVETVDMYLYNGVKLPALPEYDTETYECAYIAENVAMKGWYALFISDAPLVYDKLTNTMIRPDGCTVMRSTSSGESWSEFLAHDADSLLAPIWANYEVKDTNGGTHMERSEPAKFWEHSRSFLIGLALGLAGKPLPISQGKEPIAYFYGHIAKEGETATHTIDGVGYVGVVLPKLPEWDKEAYPYAVILYYSAKGKYTLVVGDTVNCYTGAGAKYILQWLGKFSSFECSSAGWNELSRGETPVSFHANNVIWVNFNVVYNESVTVLSTSDCIGLPIYE